MSVGLDAVEPFFEPREQAPSGAGGKLLDTRPDRFKLLVIIGVWRPTALGTLAALRAMASLSPWRCIGTETALSLPTAPWALYLIVAFGSGACLLFGAMLAHGAFEPLMDGIALGVIED